MPCKTVPRSGSWGRNYSTILNHNRARAKWLTRDFSLRFIQCKKALELAIFETPIKRAAPGGKYTPQRTRPTRRYRFPCVFAFCPFFHIPPIGRALGVRTSRINTAKTRIIENKATIGRTEFPLWIKGRKHTESTGILPQSSAETGREEYGIQRTSLGEATLVSCGTRCDREQVNNPHSHDAVCAQIFSQSLVSFRIPVAWLVPSTN